MSFNDATSDTAVSTVTLNSDVATIATTTNTWTIPNTYQTYYQYTYNPTCPYCHQWIGYNNCHACYYTQPGWIPAITPTIPLTSRPQVTTFGGYIEHFSELPQDAVMGTGYYVKDLNTLVVRDISGWYVYDTAQTPGYPVRDPIDPDDATTEKLLPVPKGVTNWPPND